MSLLLRPGNYTRAACYKGTDPRGCAQWSWVCSGSWGMTGSCHRHKDSDCHTDQGSGHHTVVDWDSPDQGSQAVVGQDNLGNPDQDIPAVDQGKVGWDIGDTVHFRQEFEDKYSDTDSEEHWRGSDQRWDCCCWYCNWDCNCQRRDAYSPAWD